jgi:hypothetical protein
VLTLVIKIVLNRGASGHRESCLDFLFANIHEHIHIIHVVLVSYYDTFLVAQILFSVRGVEC